MSEKVPQVDTDRFVQTEGGLYLPGRSLQNVVNPNQSVLDAAMQVGMKEKKLGSVLYGKEKDAEIAEKAFDDMLDPRNVIELKNLIETKASHRNDEEAHLDNMKDGSKPAREKATTTSIRARLMEEYMHLGDHNNTREIPEIVRKSLDDLLGKSYDELELMGKKRGETRSASNQNVQAATDSGNTDINKSENNPNKSVTVAKKGRKTRDHGKFTYSDGGDEGFDDFDPIPEGMFDQPDEEAGDGRYGYKGSELDHPQDFVNPEYDGPVKPHNEIELYKKEFEQPDAPVELLDSTRAYAEATAKARKSFLARIGGTNTKFGAWLKVNHPAVFEKFDAITSKPQRKIEALSKIWASDRQNYRSQVEAAALEQGFSPEEAVAYARQASIEARAAFEQGQQYYAVEKAGGFKKDADGKTVTDENGNPIYKKPNWFVNKWASLPENWRGYATKGGALLLGGAAIALAMKYGLKAPDWLSVATGSAAGATWGGYYTHKRASAFVKGANVPKAMMDGQTEAEKLAMLEGDENNEAQAINRETLKRQDANLRRLVGGAALAGLGGIGSIKAAELIGKMFDGSKANPTSNPGGDTPQQPGGPNQGTNNGPMGGHGTVNSGPDNPHLGANPNVVNTGSGPGLNGAPAHNFEVFHSNGREAGELIAGKVAGVDLKTINEAIAKDPSVSQRIVDTMNQYHPGSFRIVDGAPYSSAGKVDFGSQELHDALRKVIGL